MLFTRLLLMLMLPPPQLLPRPQLGEPQPHRLPAIATPVPKARPRTSALPTGQPK